MALGRSIAGANHGTWYEEQTHLVNTASKEELENLSDKFDERFQDTINTLNHAYDGVNIMRDAKKMMDNPAIMESYKELMLNPILEELRNVETESETERIHLEQVAEQLDQAWEASKSSFLIQESYNVANYLPLSTLDFPALIKQYIRFLGKDIIPVQTASTTNIEQRIFIKYLVNNQTGEEFETPAIYWQKDEDGNPLWKKIWNAGKGLRIKPAKIDLSTIYNAPNKKLDILQASYLLDENDQTPTGFVKTPRTRLSYDFNIRYVQATVTIPEHYDALTEEPADWSTAYTSYFTYNASTGEYEAVPTGTGAPTFETGKYFKHVSADTESVKVKLPGGGIDINVQTGGTFLNGGITETMKLPVVDPTTNQNTGKTVSFSDQLSGSVDFIKGTITASSCGVITGIYIDGHISNETNLRTIGFREYPEYRKFLISDGCRFQLPFTVEDFTEANSTLNFNLYNRLVQELVCAQEMFEDESILEYLEDDFVKYDNYDSNIWSLESYTHTEFADLKPYTNYAGNPFTYRTDAVDNAIMTVIYELCDRGKLDNLGFVIYCNPKCARLLKNFVTWTVSKSTEIGGVQMNHAFGVVTDTDIPIRVVASNRVDAYTIIPAYQPGTDASVDRSKEYIFKIVAYPMDKFHISYKHLRFARHLTNSPENAAYADAQNPGGAAVLVTTSSQYKTISIQGIQGRVICKNSELVPDRNAGLIVTTNMA